ncbi:MAG: YdiU family protein [Pseudomonadota bacterium]
MQALPFDNTYVRLPEKFYSRLNPVAVDKPGHIRVNRGLAVELGLDPNWLDSAEGTQVLAGNQVPAGADPIATVYAGHQFGSYNPQLGDGRAVLLGEIIAPDGERYDVQLKGSGPTPYSRGGDGRSPVGPVLREYIVSEAMHNLGVPTTRALAAVSSGELVAREQFEPGAVLTRIASSHIRIGTVEFFAARGDKEALAALCDYVIRRHYPEAAQSENPTLAMLKAVIHKQAELIARWQVLGFIHGVMNTDNMLLSGETIDYGPCAFMDQFNPDQVYSSIDQRGRYAYRNQPGIAHWNLSRLAQALLPVLDTDEDAAVASAQAAIDQFPVLFLDAHTGGLANKLGIQTLHENDTELIEGLFQAMANHGLDFTLTFRQLADLADPQHGGGQRVSALFPAPQGLLDWAEEWQQRIASEPTSGEQRQQHMYRANPIFIPRNHLVQSAIDTATERGDFRAFHKLVDALAHPYEFQAELARYATPPKPEEVVRQTFCGT